MKNYWTILLIFFLYSFTNINIPINQSEKKTPKIKANEWEILFDGNEVSKWRGKSGTEFPSKGWKIEDGMLFLDGKGGGDIFTEEKYGDFDLVFQFNFTEGANSGIKYFVDTIVNVKTGNEIFNGPEYQIIDDFTNTHIKNDPNGLSSTGSAYLLYAPQNKNLNPHGQWNTGRIIAKNGQVEHWLNGVRVVKYKRGSKDFLKRKADTKFIHDKNYGEVKSGHILITDHNDKVFFKEIKIKRL